MLLEWPNEQSERRPLALRLYAATVLALCFNTSAFADCNVLSSGPAGIATLALPTNLATPRDGVVGTILYDSNWVSTPDTKANCSGTSAITFGYGSAMTPVSGQAGVYKTGLDGVGIKVAWVNGMSGTPDMTATSLVNWPASNGGSAGAKTYGPMGRFRVQLMVTGQVAAGSFSLPAKLATGNYGSAEINVLQLSNNTTSVAAPACTVQQSAVSVTMPVASGRYLPSVGSTTGDTGFSISINCPSPVSVSMTMTDAANPTNVSSTLSLSPTSTAKGVGYQIVYNGTVISYGSDSAIANNVNQFSVGTVSTSGVLAIPFTARYVRTGAITPGTADANATFTMSYQ
ncbi:fimbrial protein [Burkholderia sp. S171]|uniref:fimbrial protein n=1 Tax=Burkholderia sp. S171 TaxID=1641860 RepID=UPI00131B6551|nr:fimbrial protein [Burkholderia sp. S171]